MILIFFPSPLRIPFSAYLKMPFFLHPSFKKPSSISDIFMFIQYKPLDSNKFHLNINGLEDYTESYLELFILDYSPGSAATTVPVPSFLPTPCSGTPRYTLIYRVGLRVNLVQKPPSLPSLHVIS